MPKKLTILDSDDSGPESDTDVKFAVNKDYAEKYENWRKKEELQKLKDRYGDVDVNAEDDDEESSDSEIEDDKAEEWTESNEKNFLKTLSALRGKDPKIYRGTDFFSQDGQPEKSDVKAENKSEPMYLKDYERKIITEHDGIYKDDEQSDGSNDSDTQIPYAEQQKKLKKSFKVEIEPDDDFLTKRVKSKDDEEKEEADYRLWLKGQQVEMDVKEANEMKNLRDSWNDPNIEEGEKFLRDYLLNKQYEETDDSQCIPTYDEIVEDPISLEEEEEILEKQEQFERKYNFRFEEPDDDFIKTYPRTIEDSVRRTDDRRKEQRESYKERKEKEKKQRKDELKQLKKLKRGEIMDKLDKLRQVSGSDKIVFDPDDVEGDFDPAVYDRRMQELFSDDYYSKNSIDAEKPEFSDSGSDMEYDVETDEKPGTSSLKESVESEEKTEFDKSSEHSTTLPKRLQKSQFSKALQRQKPLFDPKEKTFEEYFDEYYKLNYEDLIGDMPCRFKYRQVEPNDFGLDVEEVLAADDKELNAWATLKKMTQYRDEKEEKFDAISYKKKAQNVEKKKKILTSVYSEKPKTASEDIGPEQSTVPDHQDKTSKRRRLRKKKNSVTNDVGKTAGATTNSTKKQKAIETTSSDSNKQPVVPNSADKKKKAPANRKKRKFEGKKPEDYVEKMSDERLRAYGMNPKRFRNKMKYKQKEK